MPSTSSRSLSIVSSSAASTFSRSNGSVLDGRRLNHQPSPVMVSPSSSSVRDAGPAGELRADPLGRRGLVGHLAVDLAGGHVPAVTSQQLGQRGVLLAERGQHVQRRQHARVGEPEVTEVEVAGVLAAEHGAGLGHPRLDERVPDPGAYRDAAVLGDDLGHRAGGDQVVDDGGAGLAGQLPDGDQRGEHRGRDDVAALVHHEAAVRVAVEGQADVGPGIDHRALQVAQVRRIDRVGLVVRERAVQLEVERHQGDRQPLEDLRHGVPGHPVARVHGHLQRPDGGQVDQLLEVVRVPGQQVPLHDDAGGAVVRRQALGRRVAQLRSARSPRRPAGPPPGTA